MDDKELLAFLDQIKWLPERHPRGFAEMLLSEAKAGVADVLAKQQGTPSEYPSIVAATLVDALQNQYGINTAAACWGVWELIRDRQLLAKRAAWGGVVTIGGQPPQYTTAKDAQPSQIKWADFRVVATPALFGSSNAPPPQDVVCLGDRRYSTGQGPALVLTEAEDTVLQALIELGSADIDKLKNHSGKSDAPRILKAIKKKHPALSEAIILPGGKGRGGYRTTIQMAT